MTSKAAKCCCCPPCTVKTRCCKCVCRRLCVTFDPTNDTDDDYNKCEVLSINLDWDEGAEDWHGSLAGVDLKYFFDDTDEGCFFKLRSNALGFPEGYERIWTIGHEEGDISCLNPATVVDVPGDECHAGTITTSCAPMFYPNYCTGCGCACECLCVTYQKGRCLTSGKACNDGYGNWRGTLKCGEYGEDIEITIAMFPRNATCNPAYDPYCDPDDKTCVLIMSLGNDSQLPTEVSCPDIGGSWTIEEYGEETIHITARCAVCTEDCKSKVTVCCEGFVLPDTVYVTLDIESRAECEDLNTGAITPISNGHCATYVFTLIRPHGTFFWNSDSIYSPDCACLNNLTVTNPTWAMTLSCGDGTGSPGPFYLGWYPTVDSACRLLVGDSSGRIEALILSCSPFFGTAIALGAPTGNYCCFPPGWMPYAPPGCHVYNTFKLTITS